MARLHHRSITPTVVPLLPRSPRPACWGTTVPLSKVALEWLPPGWLALVRFTVAAAVLLGVARFRVRAACRPAVLATGALGYGGTVLVQNLAITRTSVSDAALLIGRRR